MKFNRRRGMKQWLTDPGNPLPMVLFWLIVAAAILRILFELFLILTD